MSHTTKVRGIKIMDIRALESAVKELNKNGLRVELIPNAVPRAYFSNQEGMGQADYVISIPDARYDVGLYKQDDGSFEPRTDFYGGSVERVLGAVASKKENTDQAKLGKLMQMYGIHAATEKARKQGLNVQRKTAVDGVVQLVVSGFA